MSSFITTADGGYLNVRSVESINIGTVIEKFNVYCISSSGQKYIVSEGIQTLEEAKQKLEEILESIDRKLEL